MKRIVNIYTPERILSLKPREIFVFGSNAAGGHYGGAAWTAYNRFGAHWGVGEGLTGKTYALPTLDKNLDKLTPDELQQSIRHLIKAIKDDHGARIWLLTPVGTGVAGWAVNEVADTLWAVIGEEDEGGLWQLRNLVIPREFVRTELERLLYETWAEGRGVMLLRRENDELYQNTLRDVTTKLLLIREKYGKGDENL